jgi:hypothetical protein
VCGGRVGTPFRQLLEQPERTQPERTQPTQPTQPEESTLPEQPERTQPTHPMHTEMEAATEQAAAMIQPATLVRALWCRNSGAKALTSWAESRCT